VYDHEGNHLGNTSEGFVGEPLVYEGTKKHDWKSMTANAAVNVKGVSLLQDAGLSSKALSNIYTHILKEGGFNIKNLIGNAVAVRNGDDQFNNPSDRQFASGTIGLPTKVSVNQQHSSATDLLTTVENIQNLLGVHELQGHGQNKFGTPFKTHHKAFELQIKHSTWDNTTSNYKAAILQGYLFHYNNEVPNARSSSQYLKYYNLMNLYKK
jgi:lambda repressor-like predicted transcriptional regulator